MVCGCLYPVVSKRYGVFRCLYDLVLLVIGSYMSTWQRRNDGDFSDRRYTRADCEWTSHGLPIKV